MGPLGIGEVIVLFILALLIFGPKKLPELGKTFGKGMAEFKRASNELKTTFRREMDNIEQETKEVKYVANDMRQDINRSYYDDSEDDYYSDYDYAESSPTSKGSASEPGTAEAAGDSERSHEPSATNGPPSNSVGVQVNAADTPGSSEEPGDQSVSGSPESPEVAASKSA